MALNTKFPTHSGTQAAFPAQIIEKARSQIHKRDACRLTDVTDEARDNQMQKLLYWASNLLRKLRARFRIAVPSEPMISELLRVRRQFCPGPNAARAGELAELN